MDEFSGPLSREAVDIIQRLHAAARQSGGVLFIAVDAWSERSAP